MNWIWIWLVVAIVAAIGEMMSTGLFLASFAVAAIITAVLALALPFTLQIAVFAGLSLLGIAVFRPIVVGALGWGPTAQTSGRVSQSHIVNRRAIVTRIVDETGGQIRIGEGEFWSARPFDTTDTMPVGSAVEVVLVDGLTALVTPVTQPALSSESTAQKGT